MSLTISFVISSQLVAHALFWNVKSRHKQVIPTFFHTHTRYRHILFLYSCYYSTTVIIFFYSLSLSFFFCLYCVYFYFTAYVNIHLCESLREKTIEEQEKNAVCLPERVLVRKVRTYNFFALFMWHVLSERYLHYLFSIFYIWFITV